MADPSDIWRICNVEYKGAKQVIDSRIKRVFSRRPEPTILVGHAACSNEPNPLVVLEKFSRR